MNLFKNELTRKREKGHLLLPIQLITISDGDRTIWGWTAGHAGFEQRIAHNYKANLIIQTPE